MRLSGVPTRQTITIDIFQMTFPLQYHSEHARKLKNKRAIILLGTIIIAIAVVGWNIYSHGTLRRALLLVDQWRCMRFLTSNELPVYEERMRTIGDANAADGWYISSHAIPPAWREIEQATVSYRNTGGFGRMYTPTDLVFLGKLISPSGFEYTVLITLTPYDDDSFRSQFEANPIAPAHCQWDAISIKKFTLLGSPPAISGSQTLFGTPFKRKHGDFKIYGGYVDPSRSSRLVIPVECDGVTARVQIELNDDGSFTAVDCTPAVSGSDIGQ
jgi:hypothetical protein